MQLVRCALLTITFGILLITASCGDEMVVPTSGAAGMVISVKGKVTASRSGQALRELKVDDVVFVEDTITTAAGAAVAIGLTHNNARWTVGENTEKPVQSSRAWTAARKSASPFAKKEDIKTAAAASNHEKQAGQSSSTLGAEAEQDESVAAKLPEPSGAANQAVLEAIATGGPEDDASRPRRARLPKSPGPSGPGGSGGDAIGDDDDDDLDKRGSGNGNESVTTGPPPPPRPPSATSSTTISSEHATRSPIETIANQCKSKVNAKGTLTYELVVENGKFKSFTTKGVELKAKEVELEAFSNCMRSKIKKPKNLSELHSAEGSLKFE